MAASSISGNEISSSFYPDRSLEAKESKDHKGDISGIAGGRGRVYSSVEYGEGKKHLGIEGETAKVATASKEVIEDSASKVKIKSKADISKVSIANDLESRGKTPKDELIDTKLDIAELTDQLAKVKSQLQSALNYKARLDVDRAFHFAMFTGGSDSFAFSITSDFSSPPPHLSDMDGSYKKVRKEVRRLRKLVLKKESALRDLRSSSTIKR